MCSVHQGAASLKDPLCPKAQGPVMLLLLPLVHRLTQEVKCYSDRAHHRNSNEQRPQRMPEAQSPS